MSTPFPAAAQARAAALSPRIFAHRRALVAHVRARYPALCPGRAEDAVSEVFIVLCRHPERFEVARDRDGVPGMLTLARRVARFAANDQLRRAAFRSEEGVTAGDPEDVRPAGQEAVAALPRDLDALILRVAREVSRRHAAPLAEALRDKLATGDDDTAVASRCGVRREYVNRAWRALVATVLAD